MESFVAMFQSAWTLFVMLFFVGVIAWTFSSRNKKRFEEAAQDIIDDDDSVAALSKEHKDNV